MAVYALDDLVPDIDPAAWVHPDATVVGSVRLGPGASVWPGAVLRGDFGTITIGARTSVQDGTVIHAAERTPTVVGAGCVLGHLAHLEGATVGDGSLVGSGAVVLEAVLEPGCLVGAGAVVPAGVVVPTGAMALGVPCRIRPDAVAPGFAAAVAARYVANAERYRTGLRRLA